jgi:mevalonate kinase
MTSFQVSAPGKIIINGEHSVVYNKTAIAGPIGLRTYFKLKETPSDEVITFKYERLNLIAQMSIANANLLLNELDCNENLKPSDFLLKIRISKDFILKYMNFNCADKQPSDKEEMALCATLYMLNRIFKSEKIEKVEKCFYVTIDSDMSIGAGVGSSASYAVCLASGFFMYSQTLNKKISYADLKEFSFNGNNEMLEKISQWAFDSEIIMHEKPSGIDNTICTFGELIKFNRGKAPEPIKMNGKIDILLVDTCVSRSTSHVVARLANFKNKYPELTNSIFDAIGYLVHDVITIMENSKSADEKYEELSSLVSVNNNLLRALNTSHPRLERVFEIAESYGFHSKLTGAGCGGCAFVLLPSNYRDLEKYKKMCDDLIASNFKIMATDICSGSGVEFKCMQA